MNTPNIVFHWPAMGASVAAAFVFGGLWYGPILGKTWGRLMGMNMEQKPDAKLMRKAMLLQFIGTCLVTFVLAQSVQVWRPSVWGVGADGPDTMYGFLSGFFTWIGFYVPLQLSKIAWENKPWGVFFINTGHDFINLQLIALILACWH